MQKNEGLTPLDVDEVRRVVNRWSGEWFYRVKRLGDKIQVDDVVLAVVAAVTGSRAALRRLDRPLVVATLVGAAGFCFQYLFPESRQIRR